MIKRTLLVSVGSLLIAVGCADELKSGSALDGNQNETQQESPNETYTPSKALSCSTPQIQGRGLAGGKLVQLGEFSQVGGIYHQYPKVGLQSSNVEFHCSATLIADDIIITAGHCLKTDKSDQTRVDYFSPNEYTWRTNSADMARIAKVVFHPDYSIVISADGNQILQGPDLAIAKLEQPIGNCNPSQILDVMPTTTQGTAIGLGITDQSNTGGIKRFASFDFEVKPMRSFPAKLANATMVVEHDVYSGSNLCPGDSGSPLFIDGKVVGIASFVSARSQKQTYCFGGDVVRSVYMAVPPFADWVKKTVSELSQ